MERNFNDNNYQTDLLNSLYALLQVIECWKSHSCNCNDPSVCINLKNLLHHIRTCDKSDQCLFSRCIQTVGIMRHYLNCDLKSCVCFKFGERTIANRFYYVIKDILLKNQFLIWRRKMTPFRQELVTNITNYLVGFSHENINGHTENIYRHLIHCEEIYFSRATGIATYLSNIAQKCSEIQTNLLTESHQMSNLSYMNAIDQEANTKKIYNMLRSFSTDVLNDKLVNREIKTDNVVMEAAQNIEAKIEPTVSTVSIEHQLSNSATSNHESFIKKESYVENAQQPVKNETQVTKFNGNADLKSSPNIVTEKKSNSPQKIISEPCCSPLVEFVKIWTKEEISDLFTPLHRKICNDKDAEAFLYPVDWKALGILDYPTIITNPMDLSTIGSRIASGYYEQPWALIDDYWLMFNNAWLYNKKSSRVYKSCTVLSKTFEVLADKAMQSTGLCCGREYVYLPQVLICCTPKMCTVNRDSVYYCINNDDEAEGGRLVQSLGCDKYVCCEKCFSDSPGDSVKLMVSESTSTLVAVPKPLFTRLKNSVKEREDLLPCRRCKRQWHRVCARHVDEIWRSGFFCPSCEPHRPHARQPNMLTAATLPHCALSRHLELRLDEWRLAQVDPIAKVFVRVLSVSEKTVDIKPEMRRVFVNSGDMPESIPYRLKAIFAFQQLPDGGEVCLFGMQTQEYTGDCPDPNSRRIYLAYLDSVNFFEPRPLRTSFYYRLLISYFDYCRSLGFVFAHIWACPPGEGDDYIFHMHPPNQKLPKPKRLQDWYISMLDVALKEDVIVDYQDIFSYAFNSQLSSVSELPYFEGDYWPTVLEDFLKEDSHSIENFMSLMDNEDNSNDASGDQPTVAETTTIIDHTNSKKRKLKKLPATSKRKRNSEVGEGSSDITKRLFDLIERRKENFFVVRLRAQAEAESGGQAPIEDPDGLGFSDLMDGRDKFLSLSREKHLEFSSLRRAAFSTAVLCYELHLELRQGVIFSCNHCDLLLDETRFACSVCEEFELCETCAGTQRHPHPLQRLSGKEGVLAVTAASQEDDDEARRQSQSATSSFQAPVTATQPSKMELLRQVALTIEHAYSCRDANCRKPNCNKLKELIQHSQMCSARERRTKCRNCILLLRVQEVHAASCQNGTCPVKLCEHKRQQSVVANQQSRLTQVAFERRRINMTAVANQGQAGPVVMATGPPTTSYSPEMEAIRQFIDQLKAEPGMTAGRLRQRMQEMLRANPRHHEAYQRHRQQMIVQQQYALQYGGGLGNGHGYGGGGGGGGGSSSHGYQQHPQFINQHPQQQMIINNNHQQQQPIMSSHQLTNNNQQTQQQMIINNLQQPIMSSHLSTNNNQQTQQQMIINNLQQPIMSNHQLASTNQQQMMISSQHQPIMTQHQIINNQQHLMLANQHPQQHQMMAANQQPLILVQSPHGGQPQQPQQPIYYQSSGGVYHPAHGNSSTTNNPHIHHLQQPIPQQHLNFKPS